MLTALHSNPKIAGNLVALRISNGARDTKELPSRLKLLNWGLNQTVKGPVFVGPETVKLLSVNQTKQGYDRIAIDFNHQTVPGSDEYNRIIKQRGSIDPLPVAGYGTPVVIPGDGLYVENIEWTPSGQENARNYSDLSPTPLLNDKGEVVFLHSVALCRQGAVDGLTFFNASFLKPHTTMDPTTPTSSSAVDYKALLVSILQKLGVAIPDGASDSDIAGMVDQFKAPTPPAADPDKKDPAAPAATPMSVEARLVALEASRESEAKDSLVLLASQQGKVIPLGAAEIKLTPLSVLRVIVDKLPAGAVPLSSAQPAGAARPAATVTALTADEKTLCKTLGVSEADFLKDKQANPPAATAVI